jgi:hypothetical protein
MARDSVGEDIAAVLVPCAILALIIIAFVVSLFILPVALAAAGGFIAWRRHHNSEETRERRSREHTEQLRSQALALKASFPSSKDFADQVVAALPPLADDIEALVREVATELYDAEGLAGELPPVPAICNCLDGQYYRDFLGEYSAKVRDPSVVDRARETMVEAFAGFVSFLPEPPAVLGITFSVPLGHVIDRERLGWCVRELMLPFNTDELERTPLFRALRRQCDQNFEEVRAGKPQYTPPQEYDGPDVVERYLHGTPLIRLFDGVVPYAIPDELFFEHFHLVGGSGHGKTQTMQYLIGEHLWSVYAGKASVIVIDSQRQMIPTISRLEWFAPTGRLRDKLIVVDPTDVAFPVALSLFSQRLPSDPADAERLRNSAVSMLSFVLGSLVGAQMTSFQQTLFGFVIRLCLVIPDATIITFVEVLEDARPFLTEHGHKLSPLARKFFETQYNETDFKRTRGEVARRAWGILENDTFTRMFSAPRSKLDLAKEMNEGKVILIDTAKSHLGEQSKILGRFFIAMVLQAAQERTTGSHLPVHLYVDEAHEYFDQNVATMLEQARKSRIGLVLAHQYLGQLGTIRESVLANTAIKFAGGVSHEDAVVLAKAMHTTPEFIRAQPKLTFVAYTKGGGAVPVHIPAGFLERQDRMPDYLWEMVRDDIRARYAVVVEPEEEVQEEEPMPEHRPPVVQTPAMSSPPPASPAANAVQPSAEVLPPDQSRRRGSRRRTTETATHVEVTKKIDTRTRIVEEEDDPSAPGKW